MLRYKYDDLYLHIAGTDEKGYINVLRNLMGKLNLQDRVVFLGHMDDMEKFYRSIRCFGCAFGSKRIVWISLM